jgi:predicted Zn-dependent peptidase
MLFGDYRKLADVEQEYSKVTLSDIQRCAMQYFDANNRTVATLIPDAAPDATSSAPNSDFGEKHQ